MGTHPIFESDFDCLTDDQTGRVVRRTWLCCNYLVPVLRFCAAQPEPTSLVPLLLVALVAACILSILIYRIRTFNDCPEAAAELRKQIEHARADLTAKGFKFE